PRIRPGSSLACPFDHLRGAMLVPAVIFLAAVAPAPPASAGEGSIAGVVRITRLKVASEVRGFDEVLVYLEDAPNTGGLPRGPFQIDQKQKAFRPKLLVVPAGATVAFPNEDEFTHNVFSVTPGDSFDLGTYATGTSKAVTLDHAAVVSIFCNVHPQMVA